MAELWREHDIADSLLRKWREQFLAAGAERLQGRTERTEADELRRRSRGWSERWGARRWRSRSRGNSCGAGSERARRPVPRARRPRPKPVAGRPRRGDQSPGDLPAPGPAPTGQRRALDATDRIVLDVARSNPTDGTRMVAALAARRACGPVNQAGAAADARARPAAAQALRGTPAAARLFPGHSPRRALAPRHDQRWVAE